MGVSPMRDWIPLGANWGRHLQRARVPRTRARSSNFDVVSDPLERQRAREGAQGWGHGGETHPEDTPQLRHGVPRCCGGATQPPPSPIVPVPSPLEARGLLSAAARRSAARCGQEAACAGSPLTKHLGSIKLLWSPLHIYQTLTTFVFLAAAGAASQETQGFTSVFSLP